MTWTRKLGLAAASVVAVAAVVWLVSPWTPAAPAPGGGFGMKGKRGGAGPVGEGGPPVPVVAAAARRADVPVYLEGLGTVRALNTVTVQPMVDGRLISVDYVEGQDVRKGDLLARIDPVLYQAQLDLALANKGQHEAQLANARRDLDRAVKVGTLASSQKTIDTSRALVEQLTAQVKADEANIDNARAQLGYTNIVAPIDGRTGIRMVDVGNVVRASANSAVVIMTQVKPISVLFNLPQQQISQITAAQARGTVTAEALGADNRTVVDRGRLVVVDNQVDQTTGTVRLKAEFPNPDLRLWPGQFINVRLLSETLSQVVVVPTAAVQQGPSGTYVFVAKADNTVAQRPVKVAQQNDREAVIGSGVEAGDRVVTAGFSRLKDGARVITSDAPAGEAAAPTPVSSGERAAAGGDAPRRPDMTEKGEGGKGEGGKRWREKQRGASQ